jgi:hypothetical protein
MLGFYLVVSSTRMSVRRSMGSRCVVSDGSSNGASALTPPNGHVVLAATSNLRPPLRRRMTNVALARLDRTMYAV